MYAPLIIFAQLLTASPVQHLGAPTRTSAPPTPGIHAPRENFRLDTLTWFDSARMRAVPVAVYSPKKVRDGAQVVIFSHGYNENRPGTYLSYGYLTEFLAAKGYVVVSIQHELPADSLIPATGDLQQVRRPFWERGVQNILFVLKTMKRLHPELDYRHVTLIGHSNGGDMSMLFAAEHPRLIDKVISLDNRRVAFPRVISPRIYTLRSSDQPADPGVLPSLEEAHHLGIWIIPLKDTKHTDMGESGTDAQHQEIDGYVLGFLRS